MKHNTEIKYDQKGICQSKYNAQRVKKSISGIAISTFPIVGASIVNASDDKVFPGSMCVQIGTNSTVSYDGNGRIMNRTARSVNVICPIVRDTVTKKWYWIEVQAADRSGDDNIECRAWSAQRDGFGGAQPTQETKGFDPDSWKSQVLRFEQPTVKRDYGTYYLTCSIPARHLGRYDSGILSYRISEPE